MSQNNLRKVLLTEHIELGDKPEDVFDSGQHIVPADVAQKLVSKGAQYVKDDDYNEPIKAATKVEPAPIPAIAPKE